MTPPATPDASGVPRVSVVMGVRNGGDSLEETVRSVRGQTLEDWEFIIIDDGATDPAEVQRLDAIVSSDTRIRVLRQPHGGLTRALIRGCEAARAPYIARIDAGDAMLPDRLARQAQVLDTFGEVAFVSCWTQFCGPAWEPLYVRKEVPTPASGLTILRPDVDANVKSGPTHHGSVMFRRALYERVGGYRWQFYYGQDWDLWYRLAETGTFVLIEEVLYRARLMPESISVSNAKRQAAMGRLSLAALRCRRLGLDEGAVLQEASAIRPSQPTPPRARARAAACRTIGNLLRKNGDRRCRDYLWRAARLYPLEPATWLRLFQSLRLREKAPVEPAAATAP